MVTHSKTFAKTKIITVDAVIEPKLIMVALNYSLISNCSVELAPDVTFEEFNNFVQPYKMEDLLMGKIIEVENS